MPKTPSRLNSKYCLDKVIALALLLILSPLIIFITLSIFVGDLLREGSCRAPFTGEKRISAGKPFMMIKFRTANGAQLTPVGAYLRKWYLDEIPQLVNILKGTMCFVGPRPLPEHQYRTYEVGSPHKIGSRAVLKAGWTGLTVLGKDASLTYGQMGERGFIAEEKYWNLIKTGSSIRILRFDVWVIWQTLFIIAKGEGL